MRQEDTNSENLSDEVRLRILQRDNATLPELTSIPIRRDCEYIRETLRSATSSQFTPSSLLPALTSIPIRSDCEHIRGMLPSATNSQFTPSSPGDSDSPPVPPQVPRFGNGR